MRFLLIPVAVTGFLVGLAILGNIGRDHRSPEEIDIASPPPTRPTSHEPVSKDDEFRKLAVGTWQDDYQGKRTLTLREDGTGTMVVELSGLGATLVAPRLQFDIEWSVANGRLKEHSLGGEPATQVNMILKTMGDMADEPILEMTEDRMLLLDKDGKTKYDWRRVLEGFDGE